MGRQRRRDKACGGECSTDGRESIVLSINEGVCSFLGTCGLLGADVHELQGKEAGVCWCFSGGHKNMVVNCSFSYIKKLL